MPSSVNTMMHGIHGHFRFAHIDGAIPACQGAPRRRHLGTGQGGRRTVGLLTLSRTECAGSAGYDNVSLVGLLALSEGHRLRQGFCWKLSARGRTLLT
jgi:hypothetical protein